MKQNNYPQQANPEMTVAERYLQQGPDLNERIKKQRNNLAILTAQAYSMSSSSDFSNPRVQSSPTEEATFERLVEKKDLLAERIASEEALLKRLQDQMEDLIDRYTTAPESGVLFSRYVCFNTWPAIAKSFNHSIRNVYRIAQRGASQITLPDNAIWIEPDKPLRRYRR